MILKFQNSVMGLFPLLGPSRALLFQPEMKKQIFSLDFKLEVMLYQNTITKTDLKLKMSFF